MTLTGIPWLYLPHDSSHWNTVDAYLAHWQEEGVFDQLNSLLRRQVRRQEGRQVEPSACVIDSQSIKTSTNVPAADQGVDEDKERRAASGASSSSGRVLGLPRPFRGTRMLAITASKAGASPA